MEEETLLTRESGEGETGEASRLVWGYAGSELLEEARRLGFVAAPMVAVTLAQFLVQVISSMMVGHLGEVDLAGAAIATSLASVTGFSLLVGMASGLETLCGQAYGAEQYQMLGVHTCRAVLSLLVVCFPISLIWVSMEKLLLLMGQDPLISQEAGRYAMWMIPGLFAYAIAQPLMKFLQSQSLLLPMLLSSLLTLCLHIPLCWMLVFKSGLHNVGAALSINISYWLNVLILVMYIRHSASCRATRAPISVEAFRGINEFLRLLPNAKLETSVLSICLNSISLLYCIPYGLSCAASTRVSNELGAWNPKGAQLAVRVSMFLAVSEAVLVSVTLLAARHILGYAYSEEEEVVNYVTEMVPLFCFSVVSDNLQGVLSGIARGCGWQHLGAYVNLGAFYLVGIPAAVVLGFLLHGGGKGLWIGILCGSTTQTVLLVLITCFTNWRHQAIIARERIFHDGLK
ncbi:MatE [Musa troglodytarum]|uniref:Protein DETOXIFICATION n=1 Tax=Musa troglodytarum TaxID=320322 RepID=A0A9E7FQ28_9LILI|nr:MatE [Musa troglodytarum]